MNTIYTVGSVTVHDETAGAIVVQFGTNPYSPKEFLHIFVHKGYPFPRDSFYGRLFGNVRQINLSAPQKNILEAQITYFCGAIEFYRLDSVAGTIQKMEKTKLL